MSMFYFGHGSNIDRPQMNVRCPGAEFIVPARLHDYKLCFPRWSKMRNTAVASIEPAKGEITWGVLYEISPYGLRRLDLVEDYVADRDVTLNGALRVTVHVERLDGLTVEAETHVALPMADPGRPTSGYLFVLAKAAKELGFPEEYIAKLLAADAARMAA